MYTIYVHSALLACKRILYAHAIRTQPLVDYMVLCRPSKTLSDVSRITPKRTQHAGYSTSISPITKVRSHVAAGWPSRATNELVISSAHEYYHPPLGGSLPTTRRHDSHKRTHTPTSFRQHSSFTPHIYRARLDVTKKTIASAHVFRHVLHVLHHSTHTHKPTLADTNTIPRE